MPNVTDAVVDAAGGSSPGGAAGAAGVPPAAAGPRLGGAAGTPAHTPGADAARPPAGAVLRAARGRGTEPGTRVRQDTHQGHGRE